MEEPRKKVTTADLTLAQTVFLAALLIVVAICAAPLVGWLVRVFLLPFYRWGFSWL